MMLLGGLQFIIPLLVTDFYQFSAVETGLLLGLHSLSILLTMRIGGILIDRYRSRMQIVAGLSIESLAMLALALTISHVNIPLIFTCVVLHGLGAGLCLASLHLYALSQVTREATSTAAGVYSMIRFAGSMFGAAFGGIILSLCSRHRTVWHCPRCIPTGIFLLFLYEHSWGSISNGSYQAPAFCAVINASYT